MKEKLLMRLNVPLTEAVLVRVRAYGESVRASSLAHATRMLIEDGLQKWESEQQK